SLQDIFPPEDTRQVFQISPLPKTFNDEPFGYFNASCGPTIYRGTALGEKYYGNAFLCEPLRNLVHRRTLTPSGATFVARRGEEGREFLADRKSTRLNSSHVSISYAVFCLKKKTRKKKW